MLIPSACICIQAPLNLRTLWRYINQFLTFNINCQRTEAGAVLGENICWEARQKVDDLFLVVALKHRPKLTNQPLQPSKKRPLYNCLLVLVLHTATVSKDLGEQGSGLGGGQLPLFAPLPQRKTAHELTVAYTQRSCRVLLR